MDQILSMISGADDDALKLPTGSRATKDHCHPYFEASTKSPKEFKYDMEAIDKSLFPLPQEGIGKSRLIAAVRMVIENSVNTWCAGFMDKLYASTNAVLHLSQSCRMLLLSHPGDVSDLKYANI